MIGLAQDGGRQTSTLIITSPEALDARVAEVVRLKINHTKATADMEAEMAAIQKKHQPRIAKLLEAIADGEAEIASYCKAKRNDLFPEKKSRETTLAVFGFEFTPYRVETAGRLKIADVLKRLSRTAWGKVYVRVPTKQTLDKDQLLKDRETLTPEQLEAAGLCFERDEQFFIRPKPETAEETTK